MEKFMTKQESYVERRQLFKNIWDTALQIDEKDEIMNKPKVVKTLRLDEVDKYPIGKTKKQRIKNLRHVCNKILDFCDRQDADDKFYEQMATEGPLQRTIETKPKKLKTIRTRKKITKAKSMFSPRKITAARTTTSEGKEDHLNNYSRLNFNKMSRPTSPIKVKRTTLKLKSTTVTKPVRMKGSPERIKVAKKSKPTHNSGEPTARRRVIKKKRSKRKKKSESGISHLKTTFACPE